MEAADRLGIAVWGHLGLWSYGGMVYPELAVRTLAGDPIPEEEDRWGACFCPNKPILNRWLAECLQESIRKYPLAGMEVDHARYIPPQSLPNLLACGCADCVRRAAELGFDLPVLAESILSSLEGLKSAPAQRIREVLEGSATVPEALDALFAGQAASRWLILRARFLSTAIQDLASAARRARREPIEFGIDVLPPSAALLAGHQYSDLGCLDYFTGGFGTIGWERVALSACLEWARFLQRRWPELSEEWVIHELFRLFGFQDLPLDVSGMEQPSRLFLASIEAHEIRRIAELRPAGMPVYPPASLPAIGVEGLELVCRSIRENHLDGVFLAGLENLTAGEEQQVAEALKDLG
jgi:hypothetical protein